MFLARGRRAGKREREIVKVLPSYPYLLHVREEILKNVTINMIRGKF